jgi:hypothetical protein
LVRTKRKTHLRTASVDAGGTDILASSVLVGEAVHIPKISPVEDGGVHTSDQGLTSADRLNPACIEVQVPANRTHPHFPHRLSLIQE